MPSNALPAPRTLRRQSGAFDLPSVLIGVAVVAILAIGVMAAVFGVIPWAQDRAAQQDLAAVSTAQGTAYAHGGSFTDKAALVGAGWLGEGTPAALETKTDTEGACYVAVTTSKTGMRFVASNDRQTPRPLAAADTWCSGVLIQPDPAPVMVSTWNTVLAAGCREITLPVTGFKGTVNWGDGTTDTKTTHAYAAASEVTIRIEGTFTGWGAESWPDAGCLLSVDRWGSTGTTNLRSAFWNADNLRHVENIPSSTTSLHSAFLGIDSNFTLGKLDTSNVTTMYDMFKSTTAFNRPLDFDTSNVTDMHGMFYYASAFNHPVRFETPNLTNTGAMFHGAQAFNQVVELDTSKVTVMGFMFSEASSFNQPVTFNTSQARTMNGMFKLATVFNQPVNFDTANVTTMGGMFDSAYAFNQPAPFDTSKVTTMAGMFGNTKVFNQPLAFDTSAVTTMNEMFSGALAFDQPVPFNTSKVTTMQAMFWGTVAFNQPLAFDTSNATNLSWMFSESRAFNQDLSGWNVARVTNRTEFDYLTPAWKLPKPKWKI